MPVAIFGRFPHAAGFEEVRGTSKMMTPYNNPVAILAGAIDTTYTKWGWFCLLVSVLREFVCPAAVIRFIVTFRIDAVKRVILGWARTHVGKEGSKIAPPVANSYTFCAVQEVPSSRRAKATLPHTPPHSVFRKVYYFAVGSFLSSKVLSAAAASSVPVIEACGVYFGAATAIAHTVPESEPLVVGMAVSNYCEPTESLSGQIFERLDSSHVTSPVSGVVRGLDVPASSSRHFSKKASEMQEAFA